MKRMRVVTAVHAIVGTLVFALLIAAAAFANPQPNCIADYLNGAERQCETMEQEKEIRRALSEMLSLKPAQLLQKRYCDYRMHRHKWSAIEVLERYFVPASRSPIDSACFKLSVRSASAKQAIKLQLAAVDEAIAHSQ